MDFKNDYKNLIDLIDKYISDYLDSQYANSSPSILEAMRYSVLNGGKRLRSILCVETAKMFGANFERAIPFAAAIELIHAYSLVHDDLPSMDNADTRRGMPSCHKKYGEAMAVLCGDALLNSAYELMSENCNDELSVKSMRLIASSAGAKGMIDGQIIDLNLILEKSCTIDDLIKLIKLKTMALIRASVISGAILSGCSEKQFYDMDAFAYHLGIAFQIRDDFEDIEEDSSGEGDSPNFINILGYEKAKELLIKHVKDAKKIAAEYENSQFMMEMISFLFDSYTN